MKKLLTKFMSVFLAVVVLMSCCCCPVSAEDDPLLTSFGSVPLAYKSKFLTDDGYVYKYCLFVRESNYYYLYFFGKDTDSSIDKLSYLNLDSSYSYFLDSDLNKINLSCSYLAFNFDGSFNSSYDSSYSTFLRTGYSYAYGNKTIENYVDNIIYSDFPIKYGGLTVYDPSKNKGFTVDDFITKYGQGDIIGPQPIQPQPGDYDFVGPLPLIPVPGDPTFQGFKDWLIENEKYKELAQYGINCTASNVSAVVDLWTGNYNSINDFLTGLKSMWSTINAVSQAKNIYNWLDRQFELYKKSLITYETIPIKDKNVLDYDTDYDDDGNFISSETAYLKLILGVLTTFRNDFNNSFDTLISYISSININVNRLCNAVSTLPQAIADSIYNNLVNPFNLFNENLLLIYDKISAVGTDINTNFNQNMTAIGNAEANVVDTLLNLDFSDGGSCNYNEQNLFDKLEYLFIPQEIPEEFKISNIFANKFAFVGQIRDINSLVFDLTVNDEMLGTDETSDNLNYLLTGESNIVLGSVSSSDTGISGGSSDYWNRDDYTVLTNSSVRPPDFSISLNGIFGIESEEKVDVFNFSIFNDYKSYINSFLIALCYVAYLRRLFARMPEFLRTGVYKSGALSSDSEE